jgi:hypothetical protein
MKRMIACLIAAASLLGGCTHDFQISTPDGFAPLEDQETYDYRATDAEGVVLGVREKANDPRGDLSFWSGALDAHLRRRGYRAVASKDVESVDGIAGRQIRYAVDRDGRRHAYWVTVFVTDDRVVTVEAGGDEAFFEEKGKAIQKAIASVEAS